MKIKQHKDLFYLGGRTIIVAGGVGYLCSPVCEALLSQGANVVIADMNTDNLNKLAVNFGRKRLMALRMNAGDEASVKEMFRSAIEKYGRIGRQGEIAGTVIYLMSEALSYVTGQCIVVDGGWTAW